MATWIKPGERYPSHASKAYHFVATEEIVHGWQVIAEHRNDTGEATGDKAFVDNCGILCRLDIAASKRIDSIAAHGGSMANLLAHLLDNGHVPKHCIDEAQMVLEYAKGHRK